MPFHIHGSQMNGFPLPSSFHLSPLPPLLPLSFPIFTLFRPASLNYCHGQATTSGEALWVDWRLGRMRRMCVYECDEGRRQLVTCQHTVYVYRCVYMCGHAFPVSMPVHLCAYVICPWGNCLPHTMAVVATML